MRRLTFSVFAISLASAVTVSAGTRVMLSTFSGVNSCTYSLSSAKPSVQFSTNLRSYSFSLITTLSRPKINAPSVPERTPTHWSARPAISLRIWSTAITLALFRCARVILLKNTGGESVTGLVPHTTIRLLFSRSGARQAPGRPKLAMGARMPKETKHKDPVLAMLGEPNGSNSLFATESRALQNSTIDCSKAPRPEWLSRAWGPSFSLISFIFCAAKSSASSQEASRNFPSPRSPVRISGVFRRCGEYTISGAYLPLTHKFA
ncbi:MAG: hypothetical protein BWY65_00768 [Firmicutes bacterium ADurb.Bin373]|nr:MAG: hypothetical protein BWY65_00768 [Firmicutes bacterium ADurb.Bin373]